MRRRTLFVALAGLAVVVAAGVVVLWPRASRITRSQFDHIQELMTFDEAVAILGQPGDFRTGPTQRAGRKLQLTVGHPTLDAGVTQRWSSDEAIYSLQFGANGNLDYGVLIQVQRVSQSPFENLLWRAQRQWHRWFPE
jgi:hypothetical protein